MQVNRGRYDTKTLSVLDTFGTYFIDRYYNHLYLAACDLVAEGRAKNITDAYRSNVINYMNGITKQSYYVQTVKHLHEYYQEKSGFSSIVLSEFVNKVLCAFIPPEFYRSFTDGQKDKVFRDIVIKTSNSLGEVVVGRQMLPRIIDDHSNMANVEMLQDKTLDMLVDQRETYYVQFAKSVSTNNAGDKVSRHIVDKLKQALVEEQQLRITAETDRDRALAVAGSLAAALQRMESELISVRGILAKQRAVPTVPTATAPVVKPPRTQPTPQPIPTPRPVVKPVPQPIPQPDVSMVDDSDSSDDDSAMRIKQQEMIRNKFSISEITSEYGGANDAESEIDPDAWL